MSSAGVHACAGEMEDWQQMMKLDLEVPMRLTRRLSPAMVCSPSPDPACLP